MRYFFFLIALSFTISANAENANYPYWYFGLSAGVSPSADSDFRTTTGGTGSYSYDDSFGGSANLGFSEPSTTFGGNLAVEYEINYGRKDFSNSGGSLETKSIAANYIYNPGFDSFNPYIGVGGGYALIDLKGNHPTLRDDDDLFIYQIMGGVEYDPTLLPGAIYLGYKYTGTFSDLELKNNLGGKTKIEYDAHDIELGYKIRLN